MNVLYHRYSSSEQNINGLSTSQQSRFLFPFVEIFSVCVCVRRFFLSSFFSHVICNSIIYLFIPMRESYILYFIRTYKHTHTRTTRANIFDSIQFNFLRYR